MKKNILSALFILTTISVNAQWQIKAFPADELKGTEAYTANIYDSQGNGAYICWDNEPDHFRIVTHRGIFNSQYESGCTGQMVTIGLYDANNQLTNKITMWLDRGQSASELTTRHASVMSRPVGQKKKATTINNYLNNSQGYIRILADIYNSSNNLDLKIPCKPSK